MLINDTGNQRRTTSAKYDAKNPRAAHLGGTELACLLLAALPHGIIQVP